MRYRSFVFILCFILPAVHFAFSGPTNRNAPPLTNSSGKTETARRTNEKPATNAGGEKKKEQKKEVKAGKKKTEEPLMKIYKYPFPIFSYKEYTSYFVVSGYMGDVKALKLVKVNDTYSFKTCLKISYQPKFQMDSQGWAGIAWQWPPNNWGDNKKGGYDLSDAKFLYFWARGAKGDELVEFKMGGAGGPYGDTDSATSGVIALSKKWQLYRIDLRKKNLKNVITAFTLIFTQALNPNGLTLFLNEIYYSKKETPEQSFLFDYTSPSVKQEGDVK